MRPRLVFSQPRVAFVISSLAVCWILGTPCSSFSREASVGTLVERVEEQRLYEIVETLVNHGCRDATLQCGQEAADWALDEFRRYGLEATIEFLDNLPLDRALHRVVPGNVIARQQGLINPERIWIIGAHYDSASSPDRSIAPGADDNASGCALVLHIAEILGRMDFEDTIIYALWSAEEWDLLGSRSFARTASMQGLEILGYINADMVGYTDIAPEDIDVVTNAASQELAEQFITEAQLYNERELTLRLLEDYSGDSSSFWDSGYRAIWVHDDAPPTDTFIHSPADTMETLDFELITDSTQATLAALCAYAVLLPPDLVVGALTVDDSSGDHDGLLDPGETIQLTIRADNWSSEPRVNVTATFTATTGGEWLQWETTSAAFGEIEAGGTAVNQATPYRFTVHPGINEETRLELGIEFFSGNEKIGEDRILFIAGSRIFDPLIMMWTMDQDPGWNFEGDWAWGQPTGGGGSSGSPDPTSGYTGDFIVGYNLDGDYENNIPEVPATVGPLDFTGIQLARVDFARWLGVGLNDGPFGGDFARIQVSDTGQTYTTIWENSISEQDEWRIVAHSLGQVVNNCSQVYIRWTMGPTNDRKVLCGWNLDDVSISGYRATTPGNVLGIRFETATPFVHPAEQFQITAYLVNPGSPITNAVVLFALNLADDYWFWPSWSYYQANDVNTLDYQVMDIPSGITVVHVIQPFLWPDTGTDSLDNLLVLGVMLEGGTGNLLGDLAMVGFGYGP